jgi:tetratricopeptide (TPR) repeat protein
MTEEKATELLAEFRPHAAAALARSTPPPARLLTALCGLIDTPPPSPHPPPPSVIGPYRVLREQGRGGMGVVYEASDPSLGRRVAVKVLSAGVYADLQTRERFAREARAAAAVRHDHLVPVYAAETPADGPPYLVMPFIDGPSLGERIRETTGLPPHLAAEYARQIADALAALHAAGVTHRDVKPGNVLLDAADGRAKLTDFGLAHDAGVAATTRDVIAGTPAYLSPERISRPQTAGESADVYALGVSLYEMLTGVPPFRGSAIDVLRLIVEHDPVPPRQLNRAIPADLQTVCLKCLSKEPAHRYPSAAALRDDLARFLAGRPVTARPLGLLARGWRWCRRSPALAGLSFTLAAAVVGGGSTAVALWRQAEANATVARDRQRDAEEAAGREVAERQEAEANLEAALGVVDRFCVRVSEEELLRVPGVEPVRKKLLADAVAHYKRFVADRRADPRAARLVANALDRLSALQLTLGEVDEATATRKEALAAHDAQGDRPGVAEDWLRLSDCHFAARRLPDAVAAGEEAVRRFATLAEETPSAQYSRRRAESLLATGWAEIQGGTGDPLGHFARAVELLEPLADADLDAKRLLAAALSSQATSRMSQQDIPALERVRRLRVELLAAASNSPQRRFELAQADNNLGVLYKWGDRPGDAIAAYTAAAAELERLVADSPKVVVWRRTLARTRFNLSELHFQQGSGKECVKELRAACDHFDRLLAANPPEPGLILEAGTAHAKLAVRLAPTERAAAASELEWVAAAAADLHAVRDLSGVQNERLTKLLVCECARGWLAVGGQSSARKLVRDHADYLHRCDPKRLSADAWKGFYRVGVEVARADGPEAVLAVVNEWATAFATDAVELAEAGRVCAITADHKDSANPCAKRAKELFGRAKALGWKVPPDWASDASLTHFLPSK